MRLRDGRVASLVAVVIFPLSARAQTIWYVDDDGNPTAGCTTWSDACPELQTALNLAAAGDQVWVAAGIYRPDFDVGSGQHTLDRGGSFSLIAGVAIHGGFDGTEATLLERAGLFDDTVLSGDLLDNDGDDPASRDDNSYHVVTTGTVDPSAILDGVAVTAGHALGNSPDDHGGALLISGGSPTIVRCLVVDNRAARGGAVHHLGGGSTFLGCRFINNHADHWGGAVDHFSSAPTFINCLFHNNQAEGEGGAVHSDLADPSFINCTLSNNTAQRGGGLFNYAGVIVHLTNTIVYANSDGDGSGESAQLCNNASENDFVVNYSCIQGWSGLYGGTGNVADDPQFANLQQDDYRLQAGSPCVDHGNNEALPRAVVLDLDGQPRLVDGDGNEVVVVDMGAYEYPGPASCPADLDGNGEVNAADLALLLGAWGPCPQCPADVNQDGTIDADDLALLLGSWGWCG